MAVWIYPITASHSPPLLACTADHAHHLNMPHTGCMLRDAPAVEVECKNSCCNQRSVQLVVEAASRVSSGVYGYCTKAERMEWEAVVADGS
jgi:hypothetical protein